jgi:aminoglycoside/choline kinase family phosphotransferase
MESERELAQDLLELSDELRGRTVTAVDQLVGDMSTRRYYRIKLSGVYNESVLLVKLSGAPGPVGGGPRGLTQDDTYVEVSSLLTEAGIRVPRIFVDARSRGALLVEDVGDVSLIDLARHPEKASRYVSSGRATEDAVYELFSRALLLHRCFQSIAPRKEHVVFERRVTADQRAKQIHEFLDHYAKPRGLPDSAIKITEDFMNVVCAKVAAHPPSVSHFDFMASNIQVLPSGELCLLDFQDMCLDSPARDIVSLLNDRGIDEVLGRDLQKRLLALVLSYVDDRSHFASMYDEYLLHWDFRVSGRFALLSDVKGVERYRAWIPSTLRRLGRTLARVRNSLDGAADVLHVLSDFSPEISYGAQDPWGGAR